MNEIPGTYRDGHVELTAAVDWPNGMPVTVQPKPVGAPATEALPESWGMEEAEYQDTPEFRAQLSSQMDLFEPLELTAGEVVEWEAAMKWRKDYSLAAVRKQMGLER